MYNDAMKNYMMRLANGGMYSYQGEISSTRVTRFSKEKEGKTNEQLAMEYELDKGAYEIMYKLNKPDALPEERQERAVTFLERVESGYYDPVPANIAAQKALGITQGIDPVTGQPFNTEEQGMNNVGIQDNVRIGTGYGFKNGGMYSYQGEVPDTEVLGDDMDVENALKRLYYDYLAGEGAQTNRAGQLLRLHPIPMFANTLAERITMLGYPFMDDKSQQQVLDQYQKHIDASKDLDDYKQYLKDQGLYKTPWQTIKGIVGLEQNGGIKYQGSVNPPQVLLDGTGSVVPPSNMLDGGMMGNAQVRRSGLRPSGMFAGDFMNSQFMAAQADYMQGGTHMHQGKTIDSNDNPGLAKLAEKAPEAVKNMGYNPNSVAQQGMSMEANMANQVNAQANAMSSPQVADTTQFILVDEAKNLYFDNVNGRYVTMTPVTASLNSNNMA